MTNKKTLNLTELTAYLGVDIRTIYRMIDDGRFPVKPIKGFQTRRWNIEDVDAWRLGK